MTVYPVSAFATSKARLHVPQVGVSVAATAWRAHREKHDLGPADCGGRVRGEHEPARLGVPLDEFLEVGRRAELAGYGPRQHRRARFRPEQHLGRLDEARGRFAAIADGPPTDLAARARLMEGEVLFEQGDHRAAIKAFFKVAYGFGGAEAPTAFHPWQAQATFEAARCFEVLGQREQARGLYGELIECYPEAEQVPAARQRLAALTNATADPRPRDRQVLEPRPSPNAEQR